MNKNIKKLVHKYVKIKYKWKAQRMQIMSKFYKKIHKLLEKKNNNKNVDYSLEVQTKYNIIILLNNIFKFFSRKIIILYIKIFRLIKKVFIDEKYFYLRLMLLLGIIYITYDISYIRRYIISILILIWIVLYKKLYILMRVKHEYRLRYSMFFINHFILNILIRLPLYLMLNRYVWMRRIQRIWILINKILRYISLKLNILKYYRYIDDIMYYIMMLYLRVLVDQSYVFTEKLKKKIRDKNFKEIIDWRVVLLIINIILIQKILLLLNLNFINLIIIVIIIINIYLIDKMIIYLYYYNKYKIEFLYLKRFGSNNAKIKFKKEYMLIYDQLAHISYNSIFFYFFHLDWKLKPRGNYDRHYLNEGVNGISSGSGFYHNRLIADYISWGIWGFLDVEGRDYFNKYWLNEELYFQDILGGINIPDINEFFLILNIILERSSYLTYHLKILNSKGIYDKKNPDNMLCYRYDLNMKSLRKKLEKNPEYIENIDFPNIKVRRQIWTKIKYEAYYNSIKEIEGNLLEINEINNEMIAKCFDYFNLLDEILKENGQILNINTNVLLMKDASGYFPERVDINQNQVDFYEILYNNYEIDNSNYKLKLNIQYFKKSIELKSLLRQIQIIDKTKFIEYIKTTSIIEEKNVLNFSNIYNIGKKCRMIPIYLADNDSSSERIYDLINLDNYNTFYMEERLDFISQSIEYNQNIKINKEVKKYKVNTSGDLVQYISKEEFDKRQENIKWMKSNISSVYKVVKSSKKK